MIEVKLYFYAGRGKKCKHCKVRNNMKNTICWFCDNKFDVNKAQEKMVMFR